MRLPIAERGHVAMISTEMLSRTDNLDAEVLDSTFIMSMIMNNIAV